jgi:hypothetical protein
VLKRRRGALGVRATDSAVEADRATDLRNLGFGARLLEGEGAGEAGQWASGARTGGRAGPRNSEGARRKWSRGSRRKEKEGKGKTGAPPGGVGVAERERERKSAAGSWAAGLVCYFPNPFLFTFLVFKLKSI